MLSSSLCSTANSSARDDVEHGRVAVVVGDLDRDQVGLGGDADVGAARRVGDSAVERVARDDAGDVRAVADLVAGAGRARVGDHVGRDARAAVGVLEVRHVAADARVDDGDADALAGDAGGPQLVRADGLRVVRRQAAAVDAGAAHAGVERDVEDPLAPPQRPRLAGREPDGEAVDGREPVRHAAAVGAHERAGPALGDAGVELGDRHDLAARMLLGHRHEARMGGRRRLGHGPARGERNRGGEQHRDDPAAPAARRVNEQNSEHLRVRLRKAGTQQMQRAPSPSAACRPPIAN